MIPETTSDCTNPAGMMAVADYVRDKLGLDSRYMELCHAWDGVGEFMA